ncbi:hypothetical protein Tco_0593476 [Tanacetum coccineum]
MECLFWTRGFIGGKSEGFGVNPSSDEFRLCNSDEWRFINGGGPLEIRGYGGGGDMVDQRGLKFMVKGQKEVDVLMLLTMDLDIQRNLAHLGAYDMLQELKAMFSKQAEQELLQTVREFHTCKQEEGQSVSSHVLKMKGYIDNLERLGQPVGQNLATVNELHAMLKLHEESLPKKDANPALHAIRAGRGIRNVSPNGVFGNEVYGGNSEGFGVNPSSDEFRLCNSDE